MNPCKYNGSLLPLSFSLCKCLSDESRSSTIPFSFIRPIAQYTFCYLYSLSIILLACSSSIPGRLTTLTPLEFPKFHGLRLSKAIFLLKGHFYCKRKFSLLLQTIHQNFILKCFIVSNKWMNVWIKNVCTMQMGIFSLIQGIWLHPIGISWTKSKLDTIILRLIKASISFDHFSLHHNFVELPYLMFAYAAHFLCVTTLRGSCLRWSLSLVSFSYLSNLFFYLLQPFLQALIQMLWLVRWRIFTFP